MIIGRLKGDVAAIGLDNALIDVNGVGYVVLAGSRLLSRLTVSKPAEIFVETRITENSITLFGFATDDERAWFVRLQDVPGVAGKSAMALVDALAPAELMDALALGDAASITRAKGVGKKLAERIVTELSGKAPPMGRFGRFAADPAASAQAMSEAATLKTGPRSEAISALVNLGYAQGDAARAVSTAAQKSGADDTGTLIKAALKELSPA